MKDVVSMVSTHEGYLLAIGIWALLWGIYEAIRERGRRRHQRHLSEGDLAWHSLFTTSR